jgi:1-deoxy-D-xylulose-5-phosphate synthase
MTDHGYAARITRLGIPDRVVHHGSQEELHDECGYDAAAIVTAVRALVDAKVRV